MEDVEENFWKKPTEYRSYYNMRICGYIDLTCATVISVTNMFVYLVLTNRTMVSPINTIFKHIVITETVAVLAYAPRAWHEYFRVDKCDIVKHRTLLWETISFNCYAVAFLFRHIGIWMALMLGIWRYIAVLHSLKERDWCNMEVTRKCILAGYIILILSTIIPYSVAGPGAAIKMVDEGGCPTKNITIAKNVTIYEFTLFIDENIFLYTTLFAVFGICMKLLPITLFTFISYRLVHYLVITKELRKDIVSISKRQNTYNSKMQKRVAQQTYRTNVLLIFILLTFIVGELPHGICSVLSAYYGPNFYWKYYYYAMEVFNTITHISECFNFAIYYYMSPQFRKAFKELFNSGSNTIFNTLKSSHKSVSSLPSK